MADEQPKTYELTGEELRRLVEGAVAEARRADGPGRSYWDKFWDRLSSVSTFVGSVVLGVVALMFNNNYNAQQAEERRAQFHFEQQKFVADERERQRKIVLDLSAKILSDKEGEREGGQALLSHFYPGEAAEIIRDLAADDPESQREIAHVIAQAEREAAEAGGWGIIVGHDDSLESAGAEVRRAERLGLSANVYKKGSGKWFITVARGLGQERGGFRSQVDAESANYVVQSQIRSGTQVVNLKSWCPNPKEQGDLVICSD